MKTTRAAIYTRVSSDEQVGGTSLDEQRERCMQEAQRRGWTVEPDDVFVDDGYSGALPTRPALDKMMLALRGSVYGAMIVMTTDRLARDVAFRALFMREIKGLGVEFVALDQPLGEDTAEGELMGNVLAAIGQFQRSRTAALTRAGVVRRVESGGWGGGNVAPFGYRIVGEDREAHLEIDPREAKVVRMAVALIVDDGLTSGQAARTLNALGLTPRSAPLWSSQNLRNMLVRSQADGVWTFGKVVSKGKRVRSEDGTVTVVPRVTAPMEKIVTAIPEIITAERMATLRATLQATSLTRGRAGVHPLSGRMFCLCGEPMTGIARSDRANRRYRCRHGRNEPGRPFCGYASLKADLVDDAVWAEVLNLLTKPDVLMALAQERLGLLESAQEVTADALEDAEKTVQRTKEALAKSAAKCFAQDLDESTTRAVLAELQEQHRAAVQHRAMVAAVSADTTAAKRRMVTAQDLAQVAQEHLVKADRELQAKVFRLLDVRARVVGYGDTVKVKVEGSVAHDLLLSEVRQGPAPAVLASAGG